MPHDKSFATFLDERLRERDLNLKKLSELSGITFRHLECLREGNFEHLPAAPYVRGYLKKLAGILDFDADAWWHELEYESTIQRSGRGDELPKNRFALQSLSGYGWMALIALLAVLYIGFRFSVVFGTPQLTLAYPKDAITRVATATIVIAGKLGGGDSLLVNEEVVRTLPDGAWEKSLSLQPGLNTIEVTAKKFLGGETRVIRQVIYEPPLLPASTSSPF